MEDESLLQTLNLLKTKGLIRSTMTIDDFFNQTKSNPKLIKYAHSKAFKNGFTRISSAERWFNESAPRLPKLSKNEVEENTAMLNKQMSDSIDSLSNQKDNIANSGGLPNIKKQTTDDIVGVVEQVDGYNKKSTIIKPEPDVPDFKNPFTIDKYEDEVLRSSGVSEGDIKQNKLNRDVKDKKYEIDVNSFLENPTGFYDSFIRENQYEYPDYDPTIPAFKQKEALSIDNFRKAEDVKIQNISNYNVLVQDNLFKNNIDVSKFDAEHFNKLNLNPAFIKSNAVTIDSEKSSLFELRDKLLNSDDFVDKLRSGDIEVNIDESVGIIKNGLIKKEVVDYYKNLIKHQKESVGGAGELASSLALSTIGLFSGILKLPENEINSLDPTGATSETIMRTTPQLQALKTITDGADVASEWLIGNMPIRENKDFIDSFEKGDYSQAGFLLTKEVTNFVPIMTLAALAPYSTPLIVGGGAYSDKLERLNDEQKQALFKKVNNFELNEKEKNAIEYTFLQKQVNAGITGAINYFAFKSFSKLMGKMVGVQSVSGLPTEGLQYGAKSYFKYLGNSYATHLKGNLKFMVGAPFGEFGVDKLTNTNYNEAIEEELIKGVFKSGVISTLFGGLDMVKRGKIVNEFQSRSIAESLKTNSQLKLIESIDAKERILKDDGSNLDAGARKALSEIIDSDKARLSKEYNRILDYTRTLPKDVKKKFAVRNEGLKKKLNIIDKIGRESENGKILLSELEADYSKYKEDLSGELVKSFTRDYSVGEKVFLKEKIYNEVTDLKNGLKDKDFDFKEKEDLGILLAINEGYLSESKGIFDKLEKKEQQDAVNLFNRKELLIKDLNKETTTKKESEKINKELFDINTKLTELKDNALKRSENKIELIKKESVLETTKEQKDVGVSKDVELEGRVSDIEKTLNKSKKFKGKFNFKIFETRNELNKYAEGKRGEKSDKSRAEIIYNKDGTYEVLVSKEDNRKKDIEHEVWHPIIDNAIYDNPKAMIDYLRAVKEFIKPNDFIKLSEFAKRYLNENLKNSKLVAEEFLTELGASLSSNEISFKKESKLNVLKNNINKFTGKLIGKKIFKKEDNINTIKDFYSGSVDVFFKGKKDTKGVDVAESVKTKEVISKQTIDKDFEELFNKANIINKRLQKRKENTNILRKEFIDVTNRVLSSKDISDSGKRELKTIIGAVEKVKTDRSLLNGIEKVIEIKYNLDANRYENGIRKIINTDFTKKVNKKTKAKTGVGENVDIIKGVKNIISEFDLKSNYKELDAPKTRIKEKLDYIENLSKQIEELKGKKDKLLDSELNDLTSKIISLNILNAFISSEKQSKRDILKKEYEVMNDLINGAKSELKEKIEKQKSEDLDILKNLNDEANYTKDVSGKTFKELKKENLSYKFKLNRFMYDILSGDVSGNLNSIVRLISKKGFKYADESLWAQFYNNNAKAETVEFSIIKNYSLEIKSFKEKTFGSIFKYNKLSKEGHNLTVLRHPNGDKTTPVQPTIIFKTNAELLNLWMNYKNESIRSKFESNGYTKEVMDKIDNLLPEKMKIYGDKLFEVYDKIYNDVNAVYKDINFIDMPKQNNYAGMLVSVMEGTGKSKDLLDIGSMLKLGGITPRSQIERVHNSLPIESKSVDFLINKAITENAHYIAFAKQHRLFNKILDNKEIKNSIMLNNKGIGDKIISSLEYYKGDIMEKGGARGYVLLDKLNRNMITSTLSLKGKIGITQTISSINGSLEMPEGLTLNQLKDYYLNPKTLIESYRYIKENSEYFNRRFKSYEWENAIMGLNKVAKDDTGTLINPTADAIVIEFNNYISKLRRAGMFPTKLGDKIGVLGAIPLLKAWEVEYSKRYSPDVAKKMALEKFESTADKTQQTLSQFGKSKFQNDKLLRYLSTFQSAPIQNLQNSRIAGRELLRGFGFLKGDAKGGKFRNAVKLFNYGLLQPYLYQQITQLFVGSVFNALDDKAKDEDKALLSALILRNNQAIPIIGSISLYALDKVVLEKGYTFGGILNLPILDNVNNVKKLVDQSLDKTKSINYRKEKSIKALMLSATLLSGAPITLTKQKYNFDKVYSKSYYKVSEKSLVGLGWSKRSVDILRKYNKGIDKIKGKKVSEIDINDLAF